MYKKLPWWNVYPKTIPSFIIQQCLSMFVKTYHQSLNSKFHLKLILQLQYIVPELDDASHRDDLYELMFAVLLPKWRSITKLKTRNILACR